MIFFDFSQILYASVLGHLATDKTAVLSVDLVRHMALNSLRFNVKKFKREYGEVVIVLDDKHYWRREVFPNYKANRKKNRDASVFNWVEIFTCMDTLKTELKAHAPYKVLQVPGAEADDIIGHLTQVYGASQKIMILSGDGDFVQLQTNKNVTQWSPLLKKVIKEEFPVLALKQHIIRGDSGDGVPNILSPDDVFTTGGRQKPIMEKKLIDWLNKRPEDFCTVGDMLRNYKRNETLIDLQHIPIPLRQLIGQAFDTTTHATRLHFMDYLVKSGLKELTSAVEDF
jgi:hypothetical protein